MNNKKFKVVGFQAGQFGDLIMTQPLCRTVKKMRPNCELTLGIGNKFEEAAGIFQGNPAIDKIHIWDSYDNFPSQNDRDYLAKEEFDLIFHPNPKVLDKKWFQKRYIIDEWRNSYNLPLDDNKIELNFKYRLRNEFQECIALSLFTWIESPKSLSFEQIRGINSYLLKRGYKTLQIGVSTEKDIGCTYRFIGSYLESARVLLSCQLLVSIDTSWIWLASAFNFPVVGLFGYSVFRGAITSKNWQAINPNTIYLEANKASDIETEMVTNAIDIVLC